MSCTCFPLPTPRSFDTMSKAKLLKPKRTPVLLSVYIFWTFWFSLNDWKRQPKCFPPWKPEILISVMPWNPICVTWAHSLWRMTPSIAHMVTSPFKWQVVSGLSVENQCTPNCGEDPVIPQQWVSVTLIYAPLQIANHFNGAQVHI